MEFDVLAALFAGFVGTVAMTALLRASIALRATNMPPMPLIQGALLTDDPRRAKLIGMITHFVVMGTIVFGLSYAAIFTAIGSAGWLPGAVLGLVHGVAAGTFMLVMGRTHPRMEAASYFTGSQTWRHDAGHLRIASPGIFGYNYGTMTPVGLLTGHLAYGFVVGLTYVALV
jgi:hypothetical protein